MSRLFGCVSVRQGSALWSAGWIEPSPARNRRGVDEPEGGQRGAEREKDPGYFAAQTKRQPSPGAGNDEARETRDKRPAQPADTLRGEIERHAEPEQAIERADRLQVARAGVEHGRVAVEQREPQARESRSRDPDRPGDAEGRRSADPGDAERALPPSRRDIRAHHRDERAAQPEDDRNQQVFEARAHAVAGDRGGPEPPDESRRDYDDQIGLNRDQGGDGADAQDVAEQPPLETEFAEGGSQDGPPRPQIGRKGDAAERVIGNHRDGAAGDPEAREGSPAEDQARRQRQQHDDPG